MGESEGTDIDTTGVDRTVTELNLEISRLKKEIRIRTELAMVVTSYASPEDLMSNVLRVLCDGLGADGGAIYFKEGKSEEITLKATFSLDKAYALKYQKIHLGEHATGVVAETGEGMVIKDASMDQRSTKGVVQILKYRSAVVTPVISNGEVVGIIALINEKSDFFTQKDLKLLEFMGAQISLAIVNSFLDQEITLEKERSFDILEQVDEGIFQAEMIDPMEKIDDIEGMTVKFYQNATFSLVNKSFQRQCGNMVNNSDPIHNGFEDIQLFRMLKEVITKGSVMGVERKWNGEKEKLFEVSMILILKDDRIKGIKGIRRDMTSRVKMEEQLQESKAQTELFMEVLSHDITNINTAVMGFLELLHHRIGKDNELIKYIDQSINAIQRSTEMVRKIKGLSMVQGSKLDLSMANIKERVNMNFDAVKREHPHRTVMMEMDSPEGPVLVRCDEMVDDLLSNLFRNSISAVDTPTVEIDVNIKGWDFDGKDGILLSITDNGKGVPDDIKERISGNRICDGDEPGSKKGIGLFLVKGIVERYGGRIWIDDIMKGDLKKGSRIMVFFPQNGV